MNNSDQQRGNQYPLDLVRPLSEQANFVWDPQGSNLQTIKSQYDYPPHALQVLEEEFAKGNNLLTRESVVKILAALGHRIGPWENYTSVWNSPIQESSWARCVRCYHQVYFRGQSLDGTRGMVQLQPGNAFTLLCPMTHTVRSVTGNVEGHAINEKTVNRTQEEVPTDELGRLRDMILGADQCGYGITLGDLEHLQGTNEDNDVVFWINAKYEEKFVILSTHAAKLLFNILRLDDQGGRIKQPEVEG
jgi:hypothetical protein